MYKRQVLEKIPQRGRCIIVCNHPYGMIEGVIIAHLLTAFRSDTKIMANVGLKIFKEIKDFFIFANPLKPKAVINTSAIKQCFSHINNDGLLVIFPAGRVSFFQSNKQRITDGDWNRSTLLTRYMGLTSIASCVIWRRKTLIRSFIKNKVK